ncbi:MAG: nitrous oxide reductase family maturation protein NosD [Candidatus Thorarchaeota archaeon]
MIKTQLIMILISVLIIQIPDEVTLGVHNSSQNTIHIYDNDNFKDQAAINGWDLNQTRNGSLLKPYLIEGETFKGITRYDAPPAIFISNTDVYFRIKDCQISGGFSGISLINVSNGKIEQSSVMGNGRYGIHVDSSDNITIHDNRIHPRDGANPNEGFYGIHIMDSQNIVITRNEIYNNELFGFFMENSNDIEMDGNTIYDSLQGIVVVNSYSFSITTNDVSGGEKGIELYRSNNSIVSSNVVYDANWGGIDIVEGKNSSILNNTCYGNRDGILVESTGICANNSIFNNSVNGIQVHSDNVAIENNIISQNNGVGIKAVSGNGIRVSNNHVTQNQRGGIEFRSIIEGTIFNNSVINNGNEEKPLYPGDPKDGIFLYYSDYCVIRNNTISENPDNGIHFYGSSRNLIVNNLISYNHQHGISITGPSQYNTINHNKIIDNKGYGIFLGADNNTIYENEFSNNEMSIGYPETYPTRWSHLVFLFLALGIAFLKEVKGKRKKLNRLN